MRPTRSGLATYLQNEGDDAATVGVEFMTPSVTSVNLSVNATEWIKENINGDVYGRLANRISSTALQRVFNFALTDSANWGFSVVEFSRDACTWDVYWVDKTVNSASAECKSVYRICLPVGKYAIQEQHEYVPDPGVVRSRST